VRDRGGQGAGAFPAHLREAHQRARGLVRTIVMNTEEELETAFEEYRNGTFLKHQKQ